MKVKAIFWAIMATGIMHTTTATALETEGFLTHEIAPDSLAILPPPPVEDSVTFLADQSRYLSGRVLRNEKRWSQASEDADYKNFGEAFSNAFGAEISQKHSPQLYLLLSKVLEDSHDYAMRGAKDHYKRVRPFVLYKDPTCTPQKDEKMSTTGSYPSGHASFGWAAALVLSEINPARETEILRRGYDFGESRVICGAHWQSDVDAGRLMGAAVVARLHTNKDFIKQLDKAKQEFAKHPIRNE